MRLRLFRYMALADVQAGECDVAYTGHGKRQRVMSGFYPKSTFCRSFLCKLSALASRTFKRSEVIFCAQRANVSAILTGHRTPPSWSQSKRESDAMLE